MDYTVLFLVLLSVHATIQSCIIDEPELFAKYDHEPLILDANTLKFIYPLEKDDGRYITVDEAGEILISCAINKLDSYAELSIDNKTIRARCNSQSQFEVNGTAFRVEEVECINDYMEVATDTGRKCAQGDGIIIDVSYPIEAYNHSVSLYEVCFDLNAKTVLYSKFISPELANIGNFYSTRGTFPGSDAETYFGVSDLDLYNTLYLHLNTKKTINQLIGLPEDSNKYFPSAFDGNHTFDISIQGNLLSNNVFFYYRTQQHSTGRYINSIPTWSVYHSGSLSNFDSIRFGLRRYAYEHKSELEFYNGMFGVTTLPHELTQKDIKIYLSGDTNQETFPLAKLLWRIVYNRKLKLAIVFVTVNNPWVFRNDDVICEDISETSGWDNYLGWEKTRADLLYSYACQYEDFKNSVATAPDLQVEGILSVADNNSNNEFGFNIL